MTIAIDSHRWNETCVNPFEKICFLTVKGERTLLQAKADEVTQIRETIFTRKQWNEHQSPIIRMVYDKWNDCRVNETNSMKLILHVHAFLKRGNQMISDRVHYDKVIYLTPQMYLNGSYIAQRLIDIDDMALLCSLEMHRVYPYVIDRMYIEYALNDTAIERGRALLHSMIGELTKLIARAHGISQFGSPAEYRFLQRCLKVIQGMKIKSGYPKVLMNDDALSAMYEETPPRQLPEEKPPDDAWALPIYPDAVWYSKHENALCEY